MMISKSKVLEALDHLPEQFSIDELVDRMIIIMKVEEAQKQSNEGLKYSQEEARKRIRRWSK